VQAVAGLADTQTEPTKYRLFGVTCHRGHELRFGHYTAYVKNPNGKWYMADDEDISPVSLQKVLNDPTAYLLSYIRVSDTAGPHGAIMTNGHGSEQQGKRAREDEEESEEEDEEDAPVRTLVAKRPMIGPVRPTTSSNGAQVDGPSLFTSSFDRSQRQTTPVSPVHKSNGVHADDHHTDDGEEDEHQALSSRFGSALPRNGPKPTFSPLATTNFYGQNAPASPISRPHGPGPDFDARSHSHSHPHSPSSGKKHQHRRGKKHKGGRDAEGKNRSGKRSTAAPYKAGGYSGGGPGGGRGFGGRGKGVHSSMKPRNG
jgi:hypothetical protein